MKRFLTVFFFFSFLSLFFISSVFASDEFETAYWVRYQIRPDGLTHVIQNITLTNKLTNVYATRYTFTLQGSEIQNVAAFDDQGALEIEVDREENQTQINLTFNEQVVGKGKTLNFSLSYDASDLAQKTGQVWGITIPKLYDPSQIDQYHLTLAVPKSFGKLAFISPNPVSQAEEGELLIYHFTKNQLIASGISAAFGQFQIFDFVLTYHLQNPHLTSGVTEIALPPDTAYQRVFYQRIEPLPEKVAIDSDGNWLATYKLAGGEKLNVTAVGKAKIFAQPQENFLPPDQESLNQNLQTQPYWPVDDPLIQAKAENLETPEEVYDFVVNKLEYDYDRVEEGIERRGALQALEKPKEAICMEFTDLFVTLARAAGIPAREVNGYAYTTNSKLRPLNLVADVLHSWPEYWHEEKRQWVPVDPTWEETTGGLDYFHKTDLNHFVFAIHGQNSETPYPAGSYKLDDAFTKDVQVVFGQYEIEKPPQLEVNFAIPSEIFFEIDTRGKISVKNHGPAAIYNLPFNVNVSGLELEAEIDSPIKVIPPFGEEEISLRLSSPLFKFGQRTVDVSLDSQEFHHPIKVRSLILERALPFFLLLALLTFVLFRVKNRLRRRHEA